jgi:small subunit ribosomal protein S5
MKSDKFSNRLNKKKRVKGNTETLECRVASVERVASVAEGGRRGGFRVTTVVGDLSGQVGVGIGKSGDRRIAENKGQNEATKNMIHIPLTEISKSIPHAVTGKFGAAKVMLRPAGPGTGVLAGGASRQILELAGIKNILAKRLGSVNRMNNAQATIQALLKLRFPVSTDTKS